MKIRKHGNKLLALLLALSLSIGVMPAFADDDAEESTENEEVIVDAGEQRNNDPLPTDLSWSATMKPAHS